MTDAPPTRPSLLVRLRDERDQCAWSQFVDLYAPLVYGFGRRHGLQDADAADLMQIVLRQVVSSIKDFEYDPRRGSFRNWLFTVVRSQFLNFHRRQHDFATGTGDSAIQQVLEEQAAPQDEVTAWDAEYERRLFAWAVAQVRPQVREAHWQAFWQTAVEGKTAKEVAATLGLSIAAVHLAKSRTMARLKAVLLQTRESEWPS
jgi:RNA polymerase sigma factor (sigma-70 family)